MLALRGPAITLTADPRAAGAGAARFEPDALLLAEAGRIVAFGDHDSIRPQLPAGTAVQFLRDSLILPGFVDAHTHVAQTGMIAAYGKGLLEWLQAYTFPTEVRFADPDIARTTARLFLDESLRHGVTTAAVFGTVHAASVDALFEEAERRDLRIVAGASLMDRHAPAALQQPVAAAVQQGEALIARWHGRGRAVYAVTPRYAPSCSPELLAAAGALWRRAPGIVLQSHLAETRDEIAWVRSLFPGAASYAEVYAGFGLLGPRAIYGHGIHLEAREWRALAESGAALAHCPTSNAFLGSGLFRMAEARAAGVRVALGTDIGAGTSFSMLRTMGAAYQTARLTGADLPMVEALHAATLGGAEALGLADRIGALAPGREADLVVLDLASTPLIRARLSACADIWEALFVQCILADDRAIRRVYGAGRLVHDRDAAPASRT